MNVTSIKIGPFILSGNIGVMILKNSLGSVNVLGGAVGSPHEHLREDAS